MQNRILHPSYAKLVLVCSITLMLSSCYTARVATHAQSGTEISHQTVHFFLWGILQSPKQITTPICDSLGLNGMSEVTVKNNLGYSLITVATLGIWSPTRMEWRCGKPCAKMGSLGPDIPSTVPTSTQVMDTKNQSGQFPFPPPKGYTQTVLDKSLFTKSKTLEDVSRVILKAIKQCGYDARSFYEIPHGFALVTKVEEMKDDGSSVLDNERFSINHSVNMKFWDFFSPRKGYFRVFAFLVTDVPFKPTNEVVDQKTVENWVDMGWNTLPESIGSKLYTPSYNCTVIVYEFRAPNVNTALQLVSPPRLSAVVHLNKSKLAQFLASSQ